MNTSVQVTANYFIITDFQTKSIFVFNKDGAFRTTIHFKRLGDNFYPQYKEETHQIVFMGSNKRYELTPKDQIKIELNWNNPRNRKYYTKYVIDLRDTSFAMKQLIPEQYEVAEASHFYGDRFLHGKITTSNLYKDSLDYEFSILQNNQVVKGFFPYNRINEPRFAFAEQSVSFTKTDTPYITFVFRPFCDTIYKLVKDSLFPAWQLVLPLENKLPPDFFTKSFKSTSDRTNFNRNNTFR